LVVQLWSGDEAGEQVDIGADIQAQRTGEGDQEGGIVPDVTLLLRFWGGAVQEHELLHVLSQPFQCPGHLEGDPAAEGVPTQQVGALRLYGAHGPDVVLGDLGHTAVGLGPAVQAPGLEGVEGLVLAEMVGQLVEV